MPSDVYHALYYHIVWSTRRRAPSITPVRRQEVVSAVEAACRAAGGAPLACAAMPDHVHLAAALPPTRSVSVVVGQVKGGSSHALHAERLPEDAVCWQDGYGVVSYRKADLPAIVRYIDEQPERHAAHRLWHTLEPSEPAARPAAP